MSTVNEVEIAALQLSERDRWHLASRILGSLPSPLDAQAPDSILAEAQLRDEELEKGTTKSLTETEFLGGVRRALSWAFIPPCSGISTPRLVFMVLRCFQWVGVTDLIFLTPFFCHPISLR